MVEVLLLNSFIFVKIFSIYFNSFIFLAMIALFCFLAIITLNLSKSESLALLDLADNFFAQEVASHLSCTPDSDHAVVISFVPELRLISIVKSVSAIRP